MSSRHDNYSEDESDDNSGYSDSDAEVNENSVEYEHEQDRGVNVISYRNNTDLPLCERLKMISQAQEDNALGSLSMRKKRKGSNRRPGSSDADDSNLNLKHKNAPAVMPSNRPVKRLRVDANNSTKEYRDPRFVHVCGHVYCIPVWLIYCDALYYIIDSRMCLASLITTSSSRHTTFWTATRKMKCRN